MLGYLDIVCKVLMCSQLKTRTGSVLAAYCPLRTHQVWRTGDVKSFSCVIDFSVRLWTVVILTTCTSVQIWVISVIYTLLM